MRKIKVSTGIYWVEIPEADLFVLCGCPADSIKHLMRRGLILPIEVNGRATENGPNAILLSDLPLQNERFSNLSEFPVLQMLYRQGMILPGHPNNKGVKPLLIGSEDQLLAQSEYIYRGNYGLDSLEEIMAAGIPAERAREIMRIKLKFAFDKILPTNELLDAVSVGDKRIEIRNGAFIARKSLNVFEISCGGESVSIDLNLTANEEYEAAYDLGFHRLGYHKSHKEYFAVIHSGEGDGWDINRPCMSSILMFQGKYYLIDAGPNLMYTLNSLGIGVSEIEGIFHTHAHDDHFNGLTALLRSDHRIKYYATPLVRHCVVKKLCALTCMNESYFDRFFDVRDLEFDVWNNVEGLEVNPTYSPHPVETTIMTFRARGPEGYKTYAHFADLSSNRVMKSMLTEDPEKNGMTRAYFEAVKEKYLAPADLKKLDIGGALIHGDAEDFAEDKSKTILLSHTALALTDRQKEIGSNATFGMVSTLIRANRDYTKRNAGQHIYTYFPSIPDYELEMLLNLPMTVFNPGEILIKQGEAHEKIYFILSGVVEFIVSEAGVNIKLTAGSYAGELSGILGKPARGTLRALNYIDCLAIPRDLHIEFLKRNGFYEKIIEDIKIRQFLESTWLFGDRLSCPVKSRLAKHFRRKTYEAGQTIQTRSNEELFLIKEGAVTLLDGDREIEQLVPGDFFGESSLFGEKDPFTATTIGKTTAFHIPAHALEGIPVVQWKLMQTHERRNRMTGDYSPCASLKPKK